MTTSSKAGSPRFTTAIARRSAGASSLGSVIGPSAYTPMPCASFAKSRVGILEGGSDMRAIDAAIVAVGHALHVHHFFVVRAIVVHHAQHRNAMMRRCPQHCRSEEQVAVILNADGQAAILFICERSAHRCGGVVSDAAATLIADVLILLFKRPQPQRPPAEVPENRHQRPILVLDLRPQLGAQAAGADGACVPGV